MERAKDAGRIVERRSDQYVDVARSPGEAVSRECVSTHDQELDTVVDESLDDIDEVVVDVHRAQRSRRVNVPGMFRRS
jgi:hypothetical protein